MLFCVVNNVNMVPSFILSMSFDTTQVLIVSDFCVRVCVFQAFENTLKSWEDKQRGEIPRLVSQHASQPEIVSEEETAHISLFGQAAGGLIHRYTHITHTTTLD